MRPTIEEQRALVAAVEAYRAKRPYLDYEHVCARLGIEWARFRHACQEAAKDHPAVTKKPRKRYGLQDQKDLCDTVADYMERHNTSAKAALAALGIPYVTYYRAKREVLKAAEKEAS